MPSTQQFYIASNNLLASLNLPALRSVAGALRIYNHPGLPQCQADALATQIGKACGCEGNTGPGSC